MHPGIRWLHVAGVSPIHYFLIVSYKQFYDTSISNRLQFDEIDKILYTTEVDEKWHNIRPVFMCQLNIFIDYGLPPSSSGLGLSPFKAATGVRIPLGVPNSTGEVVQ